MFLRKKITVTSTLLDKISVASKIAGASSVDEFVEQILEQATEKIIASTGSKEVSAAEVEDIANKLKGLGYIE